MKRSSVWWKALRYHFVSSSIFPATLGSMIAWAVDRSFNPLYFLLVLFGVIINHIALNMADDYFDYKHAVDLSKSEEKNPYTGGSGTLSSGHITPSAMFNAFVFLFSITIAIGIFLTFVRGFTVLLFGLIGVFCSVFYTAPPVSLSHHGLGELSLLINFGTVLGVGAYFVQTQTVGIEAFLATLPFGTMLFSMILINEIPDFHEDRAAGKFTLVARYGKRSGVKLYEASWVCTYAIIVSGILLQIIPIGALLCLVSIPLVFRSTLTLRRDFEKPKAIAPANLDMIRAHSLTSFGLIAAYAIAGISNGADQLQLLIILLALAIAWAPALLAMRWTNAQNHIAPS